MSDSVTLGAATNFIFQVQKPGSDVESRADDAQVSDARQQASASPQTVIKPVSTVDQDGARDATSHQPPPPSSERGQIVDLSA